MECPKPLPILNDCINRRYRETGYQVIFALYSDKELYGVKKTENDKIIYTDITFSEASAVDEKRNIKKNFVPKYPNELFLLQQVGPVGELIVGGYHALDCVKRVVEVAIQNGINTLVDLDLTDLFFNVYRIQDYFDINNYNPEKFKTYMINRNGKEDLEFNKRIFNRTYDSVVYGFGNGIMKKK